MDQYQSLLSAATVHIYNTFSVSMSEAEQHAKDMLGLIEGKGGDISAVDSTRLCSLIESHLGSVLPWKSASHKKVVEENVKERDKFWNDYLNSRKKPWERQW